MADDLSDMIQGFVEESHEAFDDIENDLLMIESNPEDLSIVNGIFRVMHTIKGTAGFLNLDEIGKLAHKIESIFDLIRREELKIDSDIMDTLLPSIDLLKLMVFELLESKKSEYNLDETLAALQNLTHGKSKSEPVAKKPSEIPVKLEEPEPTIEPEPALERPSGESGPDEFLTDFRKSIGEVSRQLKSDFVIEAEEHLESIEENLLILEQSPNNRSAINEVFRAIHSIKGTSDYVSLTTITRISHKLETIFDQIRKGVQKYDNELADSVLRGTDILRTLVFMLKTDDTTTEIRIGEIIDQLDELIIIKKKESKAKKDVAKIETTPKTPLKDSYEAFKNVSTQQLLVIEHLGSSFLGDQLEPEELMVLLRSIKTLKESASKVGFSLIVSLTTQLENIVASVISEKAELEDVSHIFNEINSKLISGLNRLAEAKEDELEAVVKELKSEKVKKQPVPPQVRKGDGMEEADFDVMKPLKDIAGSQMVSKDSTIKTMRVDSTRLDTFMNLIGELIITRNSYSHTISELTEQRVPAEFLQELKAMEANFNRISEDLQATLMEIRLLPVKSVFQKIPRIIRDIARKEKKKIQFQMIGEGVEIDKSIIEMIGDPLVHIVRNCCDHGIETTTERVQAGKPETGNIILRASHLGSAIAIDVLDDGAGIDTDRVKQLAIEKGLVSAEKAETLEKKAINNFIFHPGFSTRTKVTDISGRGVGMDVVITNIKKIHGTVEVDSEKGQGTQVRLLLPLTLAVVDALLVVNNGQKYAIPLEAVKETVEIKEKDLQTLKQKKAINLRGEIIGISRLSQLLELEEKEKEPDNVLSVVFLQAGARTIGIVVDDLSNQQEIVVKPLQKYLANIPGISGSTILGNGEIILILDPAELIELTSI